MRFLPITLCLSIAVLAWPGLAQPAAGSGPDVIILPFQVGEGIPPEAGYVALARINELTEAMGASTVLRRGAIATQRWTLSASESVDMETVARISSDLGAQVVTGRIQLAEDGTVAVSVMAGSAAPFAASDVPVAGGSVSEALDLLVAELADAAGLEDAPELPMAASDPLPQAGVELDHAIQASLDGNMAAVESSIGRVVYLLAKEPGNSPYGPAVEVLRSALVVRPRHTGAAMALALLHLSDGRLEEALAAFEWVRGISPRLPGLDRMIETLATADEAPVVGVLVGQAMDVFSPILSYLTAVYEPTSAAAAPFGLLAMWDPAASGPALVDLAGGDASLTLTPTSDAALAPVPGVSRVVGDAVALKTADAASSIAAALTATNAFTIEAMLAPANQTQSGPARIVSLSGDTAQRNFTLGQEADHYALRLRTTRTDVQGTPEVATPPGSLQLRMQHVVATYAQNTVVMYVDGVEVTREARGGDLSNWESSYPLVLANEVTLDRQWHGDIGMVAIYARALTPEEVATRAAALLR